VAWRLAAGPPDARYGDLFEYLRFFLAAGLTVDDAVRFGQQARCPTLEWFELVSCRPSLRNVVQTRFFEGLARGPEADPGRVALLKKYVDLLNREPGAAAAFKRQARKVAGSEWAEDLLWGIAARLRRHLPGDVRRSLVALVRRIERCLLAAEAKYVLPLAEARSSADPAALERLARHPDWAVRAALAENPALPRELMLALARDPERGVLRALAARDDLPPEVCRVLEAAGIAMSVERAGRLDRAGCAWRPSVRSLPRPVSGPELPAPGSRMFYASVLSALLVELARKRAAEELVRLFARRVTAVALSPVRVPQRLHSSRPAQVAWVLEVFWKKALEAIRNRRYGIPGGRWLARIESAVLARCGFLALYVRERRGGYLCAVLCRGGRKVCFWLLPGGSAPDFGVLAGRPGELVPAALLVHAACVVADLVVRGDPQPSPPGRQGGAKQACCRQGGAFVRVVLVPRRRSGNGKKSGGGGSGHAPAGGWVPWHFRRLPPGWVASPEARANALYYAGIVELPVGMTFVRPHCRAGSDPADKLFVSRLAQSFAVSLDSVW
jgi:hypothetical protein